MAKKKLLFDGNKVKGCIAEKGITQVKLAKHLGIALATLNEKLNGKRQFTVAEIQEIANYFKKDINYFFEQSVDFSLSKMPYNQFLSFFGIVNQVKK